MLWRQARAKVLARRGEHPEAERLARDALAAGEKTDLLDAQGDAYADLAEVLSLASRPQDAAAALRQALERYERKGNLVSTQRVRMRLAELRDAGRAGAVHIASSPGVEDDTPSRAATPGGGAAG